MNSAMATGRRTSCPKRPMHILRPAPHAPTKARQPGKGWARESGRLAFRQYRVDDSAREQLITYQAVGQNGRAHLFLQVTRRYMGSIVTGTRAELVRTPLTPIEDAVRLAAYVARERERGRLVSEARPLALALLVPAAPTFPLSETFESAEGWSHMRTGFPAKALHSQG